MSYLLVRLYPWSVNDFHKGCPNELYNCVAGTGGHLKIDIDSVKIYHMNYVVSDSNKRTWLLVLKNTPLALDKW